MARLRGDETDLFARHHARLLYQVASYTRAADDLVDEACSFAWPQFLRRQPDRRSVVGWLCRVAVREVWRLQGAERTQQELRENRSEACDLIGPRHRWVEALEALSALRPRQRRLLGLRARLSRDLGRDRRLVADDRPPAGARPQAARRCPLAASRLSHSGVIRGR
jgi:hypothetical protein